MAGASVAENLNKLRARIEIACRQAGRDPRSVRLLGVSKFQSLDKIREAYDGGLREFAENYVQEAESKQRQLESLPVHWHFIGRIQSNKLKFLAGKYWAIHSVDRVKVVEELDRLCRDRRCIQNVFVQYNAGEEASKGGASAAALDALMERVLNSRNLNCLGLMAMPPLTQSEAEARSHFADTRRHLERWRDRRPAGEKHPLDQLSMGTSQDFEPAILEGATWVRIGTEIFGERPKQENA